VPWDVSDKKTGENMQGTTETHNCESCGFTLPCQEWDDPATGEVLWLCIDRPVFEPCFSRAYRESQKIQITK
jgi:hypothetical protein